MFLSVPGISVRYADLGIHRNNIWIENPITSKVNLGVWKGISIYFMND